MLVAKLLQLRNCCFYTTIVARRESPLGEMPHFLVWVSCRDWIGPPPSGSSLDGRLPHLVYVLGFSYVPEVAGIPPDWYQRMKKPASKPKRARQTQKPSNRKEVGKRVHNLLKTNRKSASKGKGHSSKVTSARLTKASKPQAIPTPVRRKPTAEEIAYRETVARFESAVKLFNDGHFAKARGAFERVAGAATPDLAQRARVYLDICNQRLARPSVNLKTADEHYNYGVQLANRGSLAEAEQYLTKALKLAPSCDYIHYALASTSALQDRAEDALAHLAHAIELNGRSRYLAQNDPDFSSLGEDPRFTELLYPEKPL